VGGFTLQHGRVVVGTSRRGQASPGRRELRASGSRTAYGAESCSTTMLESTTPIAASGSPAGRHRPGVSIRRRCFTDDDLGEAIRLYAEGLSLAAVGDQLGSAGAGHL